MQGRVRKFGCWGHEFRRVVQDAGVTAKIQAWGLNFGSRYKMQG